MYWQNVTTVKLQKTHHCCHILTYILDAEVYLNVGIIITRPFITSLENSESPRGYKWTLCWLVIEREIPEECSVQHKTQGPGLTDLSASKAQPGLFPSSTASHHTCCHDCNIANSHIGTGWQTTHKINPDNEGARKSSRAVSTSWRELPLSPQAMCGQI